MSRCLGASAGLRRRVLLPAVPELRMIAIVAMFIAFVLLNLGAFAYVAIDEWTRRRQRRARDALKARREDTTKETKR